MVGVINANSSTPISTQIGLARKADYMLEPGQPFPNEEQQLSLSMLAASATTQILTVTATAAHTTAASAYTSNPDSGDNSHHSTGLSSGAVAGIAIAAAVVALAGAALCFFWRRNKSLKKKLEQQQQQNNPQAQNPAMSSSAMYAPVGGAINAHQSLPPYQRYDEARAQQDAQKPPDAEVFGMDRATSPRLTPQQAQSQQFAPFRPMDPRQDWR